MVLHTLVSFRIFCSFVFLIIIGWPKLPCLLFQVDERLVNAFVSHYHGASSSGGVYIDNAFYPLQYMSFVIYISLYLSI
jgi:hypothetical protein